MLPKFFHYIKVLINSVYKDGYKATFKKMLTKYRPGLENTYAESISLLMQNFTSEDKIAIIFTVVLYEKEMNQRSINCAKYFAENDYKVLFVPWQWSPNHVIKDAFLEVDQNIYCVPLHAVQHLNSWGVYSELQCVIAMPSNFIRKLISNNLKSDKLKTYYDIYDDWEEFSRVGMADWYCGLEDEQKLIAECDIVSAVSPVLITKFDRVRQDIVLSHNGYATEVVGVGNRNIVKSPQQNKITIGYFGHLTSKWINWEFVFKLALIENVRIEVIGNGALNALERQFKQHGIKYWGVVPANELYQYVSNWHFGLVPFKDNLLCNAVDPIKIYEYLYYGLTCLATGIPHLGEYPNTIICDELSNIDEDFLIKNWGKNTEEEVTVFLEQHTWDKQFNLIFGVDKN